MRCMMISASLCVKATMSRHSLQPCRIVTGGTGYGQHYKKCQRGGYTRALRIINVVGKASAGTTGEGSAASRHSWALQLCGIFRCSSRSRDSDDPPCFHASAHHLVFSHRSLLLQSRRTGVQSTSRTCTNLPGLLRTQNS